MLKKWLSTPVFLPGEFHGRRSLAGSIPWGLKELNTTEQLTFHFTFLIYGFPVAQTVKRLSTMWETQVRSLGWEDPLGKGMATHASVLAWRIPWTEEPGRLQSMELQRLRHN